MAVARVVLVSSAFRGLEWGGRGGGREHFAMLNLMDESWQLDRNCKKRAVYWSLTVISNGNEKFVFCPRRATLASICYSILRYCVMYAQHPVCCVVEIVCFHFYKLKDSILAALKYLSFFLVQIYIFWEIILP